jgi:hypothetical protein
MDNENRDLRPNENTGGCDLYFMPTRFQCNSSARALNVLHEKYLNYSWRSELTTQKEFVEIRI